MKKMIQDMTIGEMTAIIREFITRTQKATVVYLKTMSIGEDCYDTTIREEDGLEVQMVLVEATVDGVNKGFGIEWSTEYGTILGAFVANEKRPLRDCYLLYETDAWNSEDSKVLLGVFQGDEELLNAVRTLARKELEKDINHFNQFDEDALDDMTDEERKQAIDDCIEMVIDEFTDNNLQTQAYDTNYYATTAMINVLDEDGIR